MILLTFQQDGAYHLGIKTEQGILDVNAANRVININGLPDTPAAFFAAGLNALPILAEFVERAGQSEAAAAWLLDEERLNIGPAVPEPGKIICIGLNYRNHAREAKMEIPKKPVVFQNSATRLLLLGKMFCCRKWASSMITKPNWWW
jgi:2-keto-4-pentenoate hydratase/2-oxohepta-3-ene-1,7-dioic acid hydratase in catechol pathway